AVVALAATAATGAPAYPAAPVRVADQPFATVTVEKRIPYAGGTELATDGRYVFAGQWAGRTERYELPRQGGVRILDTSVSPPKLVGTIRCAGSDMDVAVPRPGLLVVAHHRSACGVRGNGVTTFDVSDPAHPKRLASIAVPSAHTLTAVPGTSYVYVSPGGLGNGGSLTTVLDVTNARRPRVANYFYVESLGCHDVTFSTAPLGRLRGVCTGWDGVHVWDLTDPVHPKEVAFLDAGKEGIQFAHGSAISPDGGLLVVNDEAYLHHQCDGSGEEGALHLYDITAIGKPVPLGVIKPPRGRQRFSGEDAGTWCTSHQLNFAPNSRRLVNAWFSGGVSVWDLTVPTQPREVAHYVGSGAVVWTAHWINDRIWVNDMTRGLEVLRLSELPVDPPVSPSWVPASAPRARLTFDRGRPPSAVCPA
ncbi:MAG TPA: hypothetical protein VFQ85_03340, partial [Mycobacteriales bacterium]|nr:hypothetical protein [Mycobacteriales bacterium]